ncbi:peptidoglycan amidohydrolase family protein [Enterococcus sp. BWR-S5]|uniref:peptidoglycan amidohydrolase family protein n=1 Tax=Enterococcus sp. BWR-S5 TaxID=2787714 RepID=UPI003FA575FB
MMANIETSIKWFSDRLGKVTYSMNSRLGPSSYDCSSAVYFALRAGGFLSDGVMGNTDSLFGHLEAAGWKKVVANSDGSFTVKRGDIFIWGVRGQSGGAAGHTGIFLDSADNIIHCNFGYNGITVNNHDVIWGYNGKPAVTIYRYNGSGETTVPDGETNTQPNTSIPSNNKVYRVDDLQYVNSIWQVRCNELAPVDFDWTQNGIACADITLTDSKGNVLANQVTTKGSYFVIPEINVNDVGLAQKGSGNYYWLPVQFRNGGRVWLSAWNKKHLLKG